MTPKRQSQVKLAHLKNKDVFRSSPTLSSYSPKRISVLQDIKGNGINNRAALSPKRQSMCIGVPTAHSLSNTTSPISMSPLTRSPSVSQRNSKMFIYQDADENNPNSLNTSSSLRGSGNNLFAKGAPLTPKTPRTARPSSPSVQHRHHSSKFDGSPLHLNFDSPIIM
eukprot:gene430-512_t